MTIEQARLSLELINTSLVKLIKARREQLQTINSMKDKSSSFYPHWDPEREQDLFIRMQPFADLKDKELVAFSFLMEEQAQQEDESLYPSWSDKIHLKTKGQHILEQCNPLLLRQFRNDFFKSLDLDSDFASRI